MSDMAPDSGSSELSDLRARLGRIESHLQGARIAGRPDPAAVRSQELRPVVSIAATALLLSVAVVLVGAYKFASVSAGASEAQLAEVRQSEAAVRRSLDEERAGVAQAEAERVAALGIYERLGDSAKRSGALEEWAALKPVHLSALEQRALKDRAQGQRGAAASESLDAAREAFNRRDFGAAVDQLTRYQTLQPRPTEESLLLLGQSRHALQQYAEAIEPFEAFLKAAPTSKMVDDVMLWLGECYAQTGQVSKGVALWRQAAARYPLSVNVPALQASIKKYAGGAPPATPPAPTARPAIDKSPAAKASAVKIPAPKAGPGR